MVEVTQALAFMEQQYAQFVALAHDGLHTAGSSV